MSTETPKPQDEPDKRPPEAAATPADRPVAAPFDWQVLLLRYLPDPGGSEHLVKRLAPR